MNLNGTLKPSKTNQQRYSILDRTSESDWTLMRHFAKIRHLHFGVQIEKKTTKFINKNLLLNWLECQQVELIDVKSVIHHLIHKKNLESIVNIVTIEGKVVAGNNAVKIKRKLL